METARSGANHFGVLWLKQSWYDEGAVIACLSFLILRDAVSHPVDTLLG